jgi:hypothetical protein
MDFGGSQTWVYKDKMVTGIKSSINNGMSSIGKDETTFEFNDAGFPIKEVVRGKLLKMEISSSYDYKYNESL